MNTFPDVLPSDMMQSISIMSDVEDVNDAPTFHYAKSQFDFMKCRIIHPEHVQKVIEGIKHSLDNEVKITGLAKNMKKKGIKSEYFDGNDFKFPNLTVFLKNMQNQKEKDSNFTSFDRRSDLTLFMTKFQDKLNVYKYLGRTDINGFYSSIYTHAVPWLVWGRKVSKGLVDQKAWPNRLEACYRACICKETVSLPIGQEIFSDLAEFILLCLEINIKSKLGVLLQNIEVVRFDDAFYFFGDSKDDINGGLIVTMQSIGEFKFSLNASKTGIRDIPDKRPNLLHLSDIDIDIVSDLLLKEKDSLTHLFLLDSHFFKWIVLESDRLVKSSTERYALFSGLLKEPGSHLYIFQRISQPDYDRATCQLLIDKWVSKCKYLYQYITSAQLIWVLWIIHKKNLNYETSWLESLSTLNHSLIDLLADIIRSDFNEEKGELVYGWFKFEINK